MKTHILLLAIILFISSTASAATIFSNIQRMLAQKNVNKPYEIRFHNIPERLDSPPFLTIIITFDKPNKQALSLLSRWRYEINLFCKQEGGIRSREDHYYKLMPVVEEYLKRIKSLNPALIVTRFPRINEEIISPRMK